MRYAIVAGLAESKLKAQGRAPLAFLERGRSGAGSVLRQRAGETRKPSRNAGHDGFYQGEWRSV
jgi:hypothetical protein